MEEPRQEGRPRARRIAPRSRGAHVDRLLGALADDLPRRRAKRGSPPPLRGVRRRARDLPRARPRGGAGGPRSRGVAPRIDRAHRRRPARCRPPPRLPRERGPHRPAVGRPPVRLADHLLGARRRADAEEVRHGALALSPNDQDEDQRRRFSDAFTRRRPRVLVDPSERGRIVACFSVEHREGERFLSSIEVAATHRGRGIGTSVVERFVREAGAAGLTATLQVLKANPRARRLYERLGFVLTGETAAHVAMQVASPRR
jgi:ribosomal protein S18 acetylase RimI-like enzyme